MYKPSIYFDISFFCLYLLIAIGVFIFVSRFLSILSIGKAPSCRNLKTCQSDVPMMKIYVVVRC